MYVDYHVSLFNNQYLKQIQYITTIRQIYVPILEHNVSFSMCEQLALKGFARPFCNFA